MHDKQELELLDALLLKSGCTYLSDLHAQHCARAVRQAAEVIAPEAYELRRWREAARYILAQDVQAKDAREARQQLLDALEKRAKLS